MAWLECERSGYYHVAFRLFDEKFKRSLRTKDRREAEARRSRLEENVRFVECGRLTIPTGTDPVAFLSVTWTVSCRQYGLGPSRNACSGQSIRGSFRSAGPLSGSPILGLSAWSGARTTMPGHTTGVKRCGKS